MLAKIIDLYMTVCVTARNGVFVGFLYMYLGIRCYTWYQKASEQARARKAIPLVTVFVAYPLFLLELYLLERSTSIPFYDDGSLFITLPLLAFLLVLSCSMVWNDGTRMNTQLVRNYSVGMYFLHQIVHSALNIVEALGGFSVHAGVRFLVMLTGSFLICTVAYKRNGALASLLR